MSCEGPGPDFDPMMEGQASVELGGAYHQVTAEYEDGKRVDITQCGLDLSDISAHEFGSRENFRERGVSPCEDCWPDAILEEGT